MSADPQPPYPPAPGDHSPISPGGVTPGQQPSGAYLYPPTAPYQQPGDPRFAAMVEAPAPAPSAALGRVALLLALVALVGGTLVIGVCYAIGTELDQGLLPFERTPDPLDVVANTLGLLAAVAVYRLRYRTAPGYE